MVSDSGRRARGGDVSAVHRRRVDRRRGRAHLRRHQPVHRRGHGPRARRARGPTRAAPSLPHAAPSTPATGASSRSCSAPRSCSRSSSTSRRSPTTGAARIAERRRCAAQDLCGRRAPRHRVVPEHGRAGAGRPLVRAAALDRFPVRVLELRAARAGRRVRRDHPVELPAHLRDVEDRAGARDGQLDRPQAGRADAAVRAGGRTRHRRDRAAPQGRAQRRHR